MLRVRVPGGYELRRGIELFRPGTGVTPGRVGPWKTPNGRVFRGWQHMAYVDGVLIDRCGVVHKGSGPLHCRVFPGMVRACAEVIIHRDTLPGL